MIKMKTQLMLGMWVAALALPCGVSRAQDTNQPADPNPAVQAVDASVHAGVDEITSRVPDPPPAPVQPRKTYSRWGSMSSDQIPTTQFGPAHVTVAAPTGAPADAKNPVPSTTPSFQGGGQGSGQGGAKSPQSTNWSPRPGDPVPDSPAEPVVGGDSGASTPPDNSKKLEPSFTSNVGAVPRGPKTAKTDVGPSTTPIPPQTDGFSSPFSQRQFDAFPSSIPAGQLGSNETTNPFSHASSQTAPSWKRNGSRPKQPEKHPQKSPSSTHSGTVAGSQNKTKKTVRSPLTNEVEQK